jgi:predicted RNase H-like nuclease (RuvC/YqgF family)
MHRLNEFLYGDKAAEYEKLMAAANNAKADVIYSGFVAQEVEQAAQRANYKFSGVIPPATNKDHYSISYADFVVPLVKGMQQQQQQIELLENQLDHTSKENSELKITISEIQKQNKELLRRIEHLETGDTALRGR